VTQLIGSGLAALHGIGNGNDDMLETETVEPVTDKALVAALVGYGAGVLTVTVVVGGGVVTGNGVEPTVNETLVVGGGVVTGSGDAPAIIVIG
jgi:hypothetical protein